MVRSVATLTLIIALAACGTTPTTPEPSAPETPSMTVVVPTPSTASPSTSAAANAEASPTMEVRWERVGTIGVFAYDVHSLVGFDSGYVAATDFGSVLYSSDGAEWTSVDLPVPAGGQTGNISLAADGNQVVATAGYSPCGSDVFMEEGASPNCQYRPMSWVSDDGRKWRASGEWTGPMTPPKYFGTLFTAVWPVPGSGWDAVQEAYLPEYSDDTAPRSTWHSDDGTSWVPLRPASDAPMFSWGMANAAGQRVALEGGRCPTLYTAPDGRAYTRLDSFPATCAERIWAGIGPTGDGRWVVMGVRENTGRDRQALVWSSADLIEWTTTVLPSPADTTDLIVTNIAKGDLGYVAIGSADDETSVTWLSDDGLAWRLVDVRERSKGLPPIATLATGGRDTIGFGCTDPACEDVNSAAVWRLVQSR